MYDFSLDCCFNAVYEGLKFRELTQHYAKSTPRYAAESRVFAKKFIADSSLSNSTWNSIKNFKYVDQGFYCNEVWSVI
jgi:hypothetical protein